MNGRVFSLAGTWKIIKDEENNGRELGFEKAIPDKELFDIDVPGNMDQGKSLIHYNYANVLPEYYGYVWFYKEFTPESLPQKGERARIEFDNAGYVAEVFLNGCFLGRHTLMEEPFSYDITDSVKEGKNLLAVRCLSPAPAQEPIDGIDLLHIPNRGMSVILHPYPAEGGIMGEVRYRITEEVRIVDLYVRAIAKTGDVEIQLTLENDTDTAKEMRLCAYCTEKKSGLMVSSVSGSLFVPAGESVHTCKTHIAAHKLWDIDNPALYLCQILLDDQMHKTIQFGFKEICMKNGFFFLNGRRIFLKCAHFLPTVNNVVGMKACGFNSVRSISFIPEPEVLDACDELGLLMIESPRTSWGMVNHEHTKDMIYESMDAMVYRDRSRACLAAYYVFNELPGNGSEKRPGIYPRMEDVVFHSGVSYLKRLRELDQEHVAILSSGRWDGFRNIGSIANPDSDEWEYQWGAEGQEDFVPVPFKKNYTNGYKDVDGLGDLHPYCKVPMDQDTIHWFRTMGYNTNPIFITEAGIGSMADPVRGLLESDAAGIDRGTILAATNEAMVKCLDDFVEKNGFEDLFPFPQSICEETFRMNERQRQQVFDVIRANPKICGYSLTSWGTANEGTLESDKPTVVKPGVAYALQTGWAPLRWSLFSENRTVYANQPFTVEAVLCNEDVLKPGSYKAEARIHSKEKGVVWKHPFDAVYPADGHGNMPPLAADVMKEEVSLDAGDYTMNVKLLEGGAPFGGTLPIKAVKVDDSHARGKKAAVWNLTESTVAFLHTHGVETVELENVSDEDKILVLAGKVPEDAGQYEKAKAIAANGGCLLFLGSEQFRQKEEETIAQSFLKEIAGDEAYCREYYNWLYHFDTIHKEHPAFYNTSPEGLHDLETWGDVCPDNMFLRMKQPDFVAAAGLGLYCEFEHQCAISQSLCEYNTGEGKVVFNNFVIEENLEKHPFADQMLLNLVGYYA